MEDTSPSRVVEKPAASPAGAERSFPLIALFQLVTFWAAIAACVDGAKLRTVMDDASRQPMQAALVIAAAIGSWALLGFALGLGQIRMKRSALLGGVVGIFYGLAVLAVYVAPAPVSRALAASAMLLVTTIAFRIRSA